MYNGYCNREGRTANPYHRETERPHNQPTPGGCSSIIADHRPEINTIMEAQTMYENIKKAIAAHEAETLAKFNAEIETKTAAELLGSWYYRDQTTPKTLAA